MNKELDLQIAKYVMKFGGSVERSDYFWEGVLENFSPSTNLDDAFKVIEKLRENGFYIQIDCGENTEYRCMLHHYGITYTGEADAVTLAIAQAAGQTVGVAAND